MSAAVWAQAYAGALDALSAVERPGGIRGPRDAAKPSARLVAVFPGPSSSSADSPEPLRAVLRPVRILGLVRGSRSRPAAVAPPAAVSVGASRPHGSLRIPGGTQ